MTHPRRLFRVALLPAAIAALVAGCAPYETYPPRHTVTTAPTSVPAGIPNFDRLDTNRDGFLSRAEVQALGLAPAPAISPESAATAFQRMDTKVTAS